MKTKDNKPHIGIFGRRNVGKSSFINRITGQDVAIVSDIAGTTTDPVKKSVEIFGIGPTIIIDTAGIDDIGELGKKRVDKSFEVIKAIDAAILLIANNEFGDFEMQLLQEFNTFDVPYLIVHNKSDIEKLRPKTIKLMNQFGNAIVVDFCTFNSSNDEIISGLINTIPDTAFKKIGLFDGLLQAKDIVLLVTPIDSEAPEGRMILPQVMAWRNVLDNDCICMSVKETELEDFMKLEIKPALVVTDSQAFEQVSKIVPQDILLTGFSIVFSRIKGNFQKFIEGTSMIAKLQDGDKILILESCTHQVSCEDIGRHKLPNWIQKFTGKKLEFDVVAGLAALPQNIDKYVMVIQCGGCMSTRKQIVSRLKPFIDRGIPVTNYGMTIAWLNGIFKRAVKPFAKMN
jgi:[FeFe] hydrogenase H-cluster maturation GTPase HydF